MESSRSNSKSQSENNNKNRKRSIAHKLANNVRRQSTSSKDDSRNGLASNVSKELARRMSRIESEDDDEIDNLYRGGLRSGSFQRPLPTSVEEYNGKNTDLNIKNSNNNNSHPLRQSRDFIKKYSISNNKLRDEEFASEEEDTSGDVTHDDYDSEMDHRIPRKEIELQMARENNLNKQNNSSGLDTRVGRLPHRLNCLSLSPPTLDVQGRPPRRSPSSHSISTPNIASSKDFHSNGGKRRWSPLVRRGGDDDDYAPSVQSSKMTSVSSVLSAVSTEKIRNRGYLADSTNLGLLSSDELTKLFPDQRIRCHVSTWNVGEIKSIPDSLNDLLLPTISEVAFDVYVVGLQEAVFDRQEWCIKIQETLGPHFVLFHSASHGTLFLVTFLRRDLIWYLSVPEDCIATTRMGPSNIKTKGAVAIGFILFGTSLLFINSHFKAHEGRFEDRIEDYKKISSSLSFTKINRAKYQNHGDSPDITSQFDCIFWMGDLNSRMEMKRERIGGTMATGEMKPQEIEKLLQFDELNRLRTQELAFKGFSEGRIRFLPTYKFDIGTNNYDTSNKNRNPSYTDRILFKTRKKGSISCLHYNSVPLFQQSDHKPVYGVFEIELRPGIDSMPLSGGQFNRDVWLAGTRKRITHQTQNNETHRTETNSSVCLVM